MPNRKQNNVADLNQGVNYMEQGQQPVAPAAPVAPEAQPAPVPPVQPVVPAQQPIVNTDALKAQAGNLANTAKNGVNTYVEKLKTNKGVLAGTIAGVVLILVLIIFAGSKLLNPSYNVVNKYMNIQKTGKVEKIVKLYHEDIIEARYDGEEDDLIDALKEELEEMEDEDTVIKSYKIRECENYSEDELEDLAEYMEEYLDIDEKDVKAAKKYFVMMKVDVDGEMNIQYTSVVVVKIGNKWSLYY